MWRPPFSFVAIAIFLFILSATGGCREIEIHPAHDPDGGALTASYACVYDADADGLWYVIFLRCNGLLVAKHHHNTGIHLFVAPAGDLLFYSRCSGRNEIVDVMGTSYLLKKGAIVLCDADESRTSVRQLKLPIPTTRGDDPASIAKALANIATDPQVSSFMDPQSIARLRADAKK